MYANEVTYTVDSRLLIYLQNIRFYAGYIYPPYCLTLNRSDRRQAFHSKVTNTILALIVKCIIVY